ncbi:bacillithiol transferase BstA [Caldibacillus lycopersici]|uniref:Putative metal-dependent hydrolase OEV98_15245 n=1 Tax=Perspicuibacillus lycopersici TaxID=1325689 RepID=A0AAE3IWX5_9BACI|nr:bacillithiol transferase BstA [Perspicuibacillus lycopersici]MCU9614899.1 bacillithiol transferase BstA [Perspicuibacillus lycopersici]
MDLKYPIGKFDFEGEITPIIVNEWIDEIEALPAFVRKAVQKLKAEQLDTPYREGGWTVRQVVHHLADSHMNSLFRFKLALTEENPIIRPYEQAKWAELSDSKMPIDVSLTLLEALHERWVHLLRTLTPADLEKTFIHPESGEISLGSNIGRYAWHGNHHLAHITSLCERMGW